MTDRDSNGMETSKEREYSALSFRGASSHRKVLHLPYLMR